MKKEIADQLVTALENKVGKQYKCPICQSGKGVSIMPGLFLHTLHENEIDPLRFGPNGVPTVPLICMNCGFISQHAVATLVDDWLTFKSNYEEKAKTE